MAYEKSLITLIEERRNVSLDDVPTTGELHNWSEVKWGETSTIFGNVYGNPKFPEGRLIKTSAIVKIEDGYVLTLNSKYRLVGEGKHAQ